VRAIRETRDRRTADLEEDRAMSSPILQPSQEEQVLTEPPFTAEEEDQRSQQAIAGRSLRQLAWSRLRRDRLAMIAVGFLLFIFLGALLAPVITGLTGVGPNDFDRSGLSPALAGLPTGWTLKCTPSGSPMGIGGFSPACSGISLKHPLGLEPGTGRDIFAMLLYGSRVSLMIATTSTFLVVTLGLVIGTVAGYMRGWTDQLFSRFMDILLAFPLLLMLIVLTPLLSARIASAFHVADNTARIMYLIFVFAFFGWPYLARIIRGQVISLREREFVESAVAMGAGSRRIIFNELIPNLWAPILVYASITLPGFIAAEAALSYLGVGVLPPTVTWGAMLSESVNYYSTMPLYLFIPGTYLFLVVLAFNILGDAVRDALDPRAGRA
jgi:peptide/nickel transport system permease protein